MAEPKAGRPRIGGAADLLLPHHLRQLQDISDQLSKAVSELAIEQRSRVVTEGDVRLIIEARRVRATCFGPGMFSDPGWDILLCLFAAKLGQRKVSVTALCEFTSVPASTAMRWINDLQRERWLIKEADQEDRRRVWVKISERGYSTMRVYFETIGQSVIGQ